MTQQAKNARYFGELAGALVLYVAVLAIALSFGRQMAPGLARTALFVSPMIPFLLAVWAIVRQIRRSDEFVRKTTLEHVAIAAAVTAGWTFTYGFLENAGYPRLSMFTVWPVMGGVWGALAILDAWRHR